jgi:ABC-2 type transport system ATP-binding protein
MPGARIEARGLTKRFGAVTAVDGLSFSVEGGTVTGFLGPNGAGKTTTLRMLLGLVAPTSGEVLVNGVPYSALPDPSRLVGAVLESSGFHPGRSAREHLRIVATTAGVPHSKVDDVLDFVGLSAVAGRKVGGYSMGMRQRLELARALLGDPQVLVLDEPANGLDPQGIAWLRGVLRSFAAEGRTVLISSHLLAEAAQTVDDVIVLNAGRLAGQGRLNELLERAKGEIHVRTLEPDRLVGVLQAAGIAATRQMADWVAAEGATAEEVGRAMAAAQIVVLEMSAEGESLEHLFFSLTEHP